MERLYVVTRSDLAPGAQLAQSCHAVSAFAAAFPDEHKAWHGHGQNLVVLAVDNERKLGALLDSIEDVLDVECAAFFEPDFDNALTAFAVSGTASKALSSLPLALRPPREAKAA